MVKIPVEKLVKKIPVKKVPVNRVIPFSCVDGPGSRTAVFLQGCNINCRYCHNPETRNLCIGCGKCVSKCPTGALRKEADGTISYNPICCTFCDTCISVCEHGSSPRIRMMDAKEVYAEIAKQVPFIRGVTVSGGECMLYPEFLTELFTICKAHGLHTLIDSNGTVDFSEYPELLSVVDGVMLDVKAFDRNEHIAVTGYDNTMILKNVTFLAKTQKLYEVRTVVVPGLFDAFDTVKKTVHLLREAAGSKENINKIRYKLITYREAGVRNEYRLYQPPERQMMERLAELAQREGMYQTVIV